MWTEFDIAINNIILRVIYALNKELHNSTLVWLNFIINIVNIEEFRRSYEVYHYCKYITVNTNFSTIK